MDNLAAADQFWHRLCNSTPTEPRIVIREHDGQIPSGDSIEKFDVVVLGGTLGIFLATALQLKGIKVAVMERNRLVGREQEWNISKADMQVSYSKGDAL